MISESEIISEENKHYIKELNKSKEKWALAFRKEEYILGIQTTSRMESLHSMIKNIIRSKCSLIELSIRLLNFAHGKNTTIIEDKVEASVIEALSQTFILRKIKEKYSGYIFNKCVINYIKASNFKSMKKKTNSYEVVSLDHQDYKTTVSLSKSVFSCSCWNNKQWGIPCAHIFAIVNASPEKNHAYLDFKERWNAKVVLENNDEDLIKFLQGMLGKTDKFKGIH